jgi:hypothetical protein
MWHKLPKEIVDKILLFLMKTQPVILLEDIRSYYKFHLITSTYYYHYWITIFDSMIWEDRNWLANDIWRFLTDNDDNGLYHVLQRMYLLRNKSENELKTYLKSLDNDDVNTQINCLGRLMNSVERQQFIEQYILEPEEEEGV